VRVRHQTGAERTLRTAIAAGLDPHWIATTTLVAATDRVFGDGGHALDLLAKAFEGLDLVGWQHADAVLPAIVPVLTSAMGSEESGSWRHPVDLIAAAQEAEGEIVAALAAGRARRGGWRDHAELGRAVLGEDAAAILRAIVDALAGGATPADIARAVAFAAALRILHFGTGNDHADWESAHHTFSYANAAFAMIIRATGEGADAQTEALCLRAAVHGALAVYLDRYLNVPPARAPRVEDAAMPADLGRAFLEACERRQQVAEAARLAACHLAAGRPGGELLALLGRALLREDAGFHMVQNLQAAARQYLSWDGAPEAEPILIAAARYLAAHTPTPRAQLRTAEVARRLMRGAALHEEAEEEGAAANASA
jgi:hypothetical protein